MDDDIIVANVGDCRMILWKDGQAVRITKDHKPDDEEERARIEGLGGEVTCTELPNGTKSYRVNGILGVARALGDFSLEPYVTAVPDIFHTNIDTDDYLVIACDGLWDVLQDAEVAQICNAYWRDNKDPSDLEGVAGR
jgi:serine/threonine protein phosphatase PrpC